MTAIIARPSAGATQARPAAASVSDEPTPRHPPPEPTSPTLIVLTIRPKGQKFNGNRIERAQEAGFEFLPRSNLIGYADPDTRTEIARHVVAHNDEAFGTLREIQVHVDPERCATSFNCGSTLMTMLKQYCVLIGGRLCDGTGTVLDADACRGIGEHIDAVTDRRRKVDAKARLVRMPSGEVRETGDLSFCYTVRREAGQRKGVYRSVEFDAPALPYYEGKVRAFEMVKELVAYYEAHRVRRPRIDLILREAFAKSAEHPSGIYDRVHVANVAAGFIDVIEDIVRVGCLQVNPRWLNSRIDYYRKLGVDQAATAAKEKAELVARLQAGRAAAASRRKASGQGGKAK